MSGFAPSTPKEVVIIISLADAPAQLPDLVRRAQSGEEVVITTEGAPSVRLSAMHPAPARSDRRRVMEEVWRAGVADPSESPSAARSQDFLYDEDGLPA